VARPPAVDDTGTVLPLAEATVEDLGADTGAIDADVLGVALAVIRARPFAVADGRGAEAEAVGCGDGAEQPAVVSATRTAATAETPASRCAGRRRGVPLMRFRRISP
jgi:hypothetical protein